MAKLLELAGVNDARILDQCRAARVVALTDGGMGSLRFLFAPPKARQVYGRDLAAGISYDSDGVELHLAIILDEDGDLFELDIWKVDFSPLRSHPRPDQIRYARPLGG